MAHAIHELNPRLVIIENVEGLLSAPAASDMEPCAYCVGDGHSGPLLRACGAVLGDLATLGLDAEWGRYGADEVGAPHRRRRIIIRAWPAPLHAGGLGTDRGSSAGWGLRNEARKLFKTPTAWESTADRSTRTGGSRGHGPTLADEVEHLLPTPAARDWKSGESNLMDRNSRPLNEVVVNLLPTPAASMPNDGESLESWEARRQRNLAKGINGNGQGTPLAIAVKLLPTPTASPIGSQTNTQVSGDGRSTPNKLGWAIGALLPGVIHDGRLSNPPAPPADAASGCTTPAASALAAMSAPTPNSGGLVKLLPTPDTGMSPNGMGDGASKSGNGHQSGASLDNIARELLPTPTASDRREDVLGLRPGQPDLDWGDYGPAIRRWERVLGRPAPGQPTFWDV
jgi:site-specific DNA-cytosine methylase